MDERAKLDAIVKPVPDAQFGNGFCQFPAKCVVNPVLHVNAVGADAGLAVIAKLAGDRTGHRVVQIGVIEHDEGRVAAQFHRAFHDLVGGLPHQDAPHFGRTGEAELAHLRVLAKLLADVRSAR